MKNSIEIKGLSKTYNSVEAVKDVTLEISKGELFGLIGPDGAGKTSIIRILATLLLPTAGTAILEGLDTVKDYKAIRKIIGYMPGRFSLYQDLSVEENINFFATIFGTTIKENYDLVKDIYSQIEPYKTRKAGNLSGGMKQKLALSCALIHKPKVLLLDEPTTGVDPVSRKEFWLMLKKLKEQDITIFVSTPYMDEANLCDRVALIQDGRILTVNTPQKISAQFGKTLYRINADNKYQLLLDLRKYPHCSSVFPFGEFLHYTDKREDFQPDDLKHWLEIQAHTNVEIISQSANIEDCFMDLMAQ